MTLKAPKPAPLATGTGSELDFCSPANPIRIITSSHRELQERTLIGRFRIAPIRAGIVASLAYGEGGRNA